MLAERSVDSAAWRRVGRVLICTVKGEGLAETQGEGLPEKIKGAALAAAPKIRISLGKKL